MKAEVWAPRAAAVDVVLVDGSRHRLELDDTTGWHRGGPELVHAEEYRFSLDGGEPLPDPRSHWQPDGYDGPSAAVDHGRFPWTDAAWRGFHLPGSAIYELHVGTFSPEGDFDGAIQRLDHLVDLGVGAIEVMPVAEFPGERGWGYDGVLLWAPHHAYGGPDGFKRFVDACHARGLGVLLDVVYNHLGPKGNHLERFGPYFDPEHQTPWGAAVNLAGEGSGPVRQFVLGNAAHWFVDHHVDGLRLDAVHALVDDSPVHLLAELAAETEALAAHLGRRLWLVAEDDRADPTPVLAREAGGHGLDAQWADDLHHALHSALTGETDGYYRAFGALADIDLAVRRVHAKRGTPPPPEVTSHRFVVCSQNHDQVGNRARGERLHHLVGADAALAAAAVAVLSPATPLLFQGEEWLATSPFPFFCDLAGDDDELAEAIRTGRRSEFAAFGWDPASIPDPLDPATFAAATLDWDEVGAGEHARALQWYRTLLRLRRDRPDVADGRRAGTSVEVDDAARTIVLRRAATAVAANLSDRPVTVTITGAGELLASTHDGTRLGPGPTVALPPGATAVVATRGPTGGPT